MTAPILNRQRREVLEIVETFGRGATAYDIYLASLYRLQQNVCARRLTDLKRLGLIEECGSRPGSSGRLCTLYRVTDAGREALR